MSQLDIWGPVTRESAAAPSPAAVWSVTTRFATGVVVITVQAGSRTRGMTVSAFTIVSRTPPLVSVSLHAGSTCLAQVKEDGAFAVTALAAGQAMLARHFANPGRPPGLRQLQPDAWLLGPAGGIPVLAGAVGWLDCQAELVVPAGDHELIIARVRAATAGPGLPLVQCAGALRDDLSPRPAAPLATPHQGGQP
jgi:flavin reductase (DIM6/NTAB) family NADH-FMN oxidoreductase RutF